MNLTDLDDSIRSADLDRLRKSVAEGSLNEFAITPDDGSDGKQAGRWLITYMTKDGTTKEKIMVGKNADAVSKYFEFKYRRKPLSVVPYVDDMDLRGKLDNLSLDEQGVAEGSLEEVSQDTARSYAQKARSSQKNLINQTRRKGADTDALNKKIKNRQQGMDRAHTDKRYYKDEQGVAEGEKVGNMDADAFDAAMARLKQLAKQGPMQTVWDPVKRVYKNVPVNKN